MGDPPGGEAEEGGAEEVDGFDGHQAAESARPADAVHAIMQGLLAITGSMGELGGRVARRLAERGVRQQLVVRDAAPAPRLPGASSVEAPGCDDTAAMTRAFAGADTVFLASGRESPTRIEEHASAVDAAAVAGVRRIVYTSFLGAAPDRTFTLGRHHRATEERIRASGMAHTFLRNSMTHEEAYASRAHFGASAYEVEGWVSSDAAVAKGELDLVTDVVLCLTGHPVQELRPFLEANPGSWSHLARN